MALYDFVYKNESLINSYYAQLFDGLLKETEHTSRNGSSESESFTAGPRIIAQGKMEGKRELGEENKSKSIPHDLLVIDTLVKLNEQAKPIDEAQNSDLMVVEGDMFVLNKSIIDNIFAGAHSFLTGGFSGAPKQSSEEKKMMQFIKNFFQTMQFEPVVIIKTSSGYICGSIKDEYLMENVSNFHIRFGQSGLKNVKVIGIRESDQGGDIDGEAGLFQGSQGVAQAVRDAIFPAPTILFTPIAIYRQIGA